jgi:serine-type D-Ala-D-Ala carboxypeptidase/endopeptidase (penicillin-binding protein 4)
MSRPLASIVRNAFAALAIAAAGHACVKKPPAVPAPPLPPPSLAAPSPNLDRLRQALSASTGLPGVRRATWGIVVHSLSRDERLFELNPRALLTPASAAKIVAAATASESVGWEYCYETTVRAAGPIAKGVLQGDLVVTGTGDPTVEGRTGGSLAAWVAAIRAAGVQRITGRIVGDDNRLEEPRPALAWAWDDIDGRTGVLFGALNAAENVMSVTVTPAAKAGERAVTAVERYAKTRPLENRVTTGPAKSETLVWAEQRPGDAFLTLTGNVALNAKPTVVSVAAGNPTSWFAAILRDRLIQGGIDVRGDALDIDDAKPAVARTGQTLYVHRSAPLSTVVQPMLKNSVNLYAEAIMRLNAAGPGVATMFRAQESVQKRLTLWGIPADAYQLVDGSGVSRRSVISAEALGAVLRKMYDPTMRSPFIQALPVAGVDGTLLQRMRKTAAERNVRAKTGTMSNVRSLAGYVTTRDGEHLAFVIMANNFEGTGEEAVTAIDRMAVTLADFRRGLAGTRDTE